MVGSSKGPSNTEITDWLRDAPPSEVTQFAKQALSRIAGLDQTIRSQFMRSVESDPQVARLLEDMKAHT